MQPNSIVLIGSGNVATHLGLQLKAKDFPILQVYGHTLASAQVLGEKLGTAFTNDIASVLPQAGYYIFSLKDSALPEVLKSFPAYGGMWLHTSGSLPLSIFEGYTSCYGVLYPLQTFSKDRELDFDSVPLFIEANDDSSFNKLEALAKALSGQVYPLSSDKRKYLHLAAVFACNFTNRLYDIAYNLLEEQDINPQTLLPLIKETAAKIETMQPRDAQTGPAARNDLNILAMHRQLLQDKPELLHIYNLLTQDINSER